MFFLCLNVIIIYIYIYIRLNGARWHCMTSNVYYRSASFPISLFYYHQSETIILLVLLIILCHCLYQHPNLYLNPRIYSLDFNGDKYLALQVIIESLLYLRLWCVTFELFDDVSVHYKGLSDITFVFTSKKRVVLCLRPLCVCLFVCGRSSVKSSDFNAFLFKENWLFFDGSQA